MKKLRSRIESVQRALSIKSTLLILLVATSAVTSCKKANENPEDEFIKAATSVRLVHSAYLNNTSAVDLYVDNVKINTGGPLAFSGASAYFPATPGSKKIEIKDVAGTLMTDTVLNILEGRQYSLFIKDRSIVDELTTDITPLKTGIISVVDNNTSAPVSGKAKVRFVNMSSQVLNTTAAYVTFSVLNRVGNTTLGTIVTHTLGSDFQTFSSDYSTQDAGPITFRAQGAGNNIIDLTTTLEADKLYTLYVVSTEYMVKTPTKSPIALKIILNN